MKLISEKDILVHYGTKGQEWGKRQYQNLDGSLTELGREHYGIGPARKSKEGLSKEYTLRDLTTKKMTENKGPSYNPGLFTMLSDSSISSKANKEIAERRKNEKIDEATGLYLKNKNDTSIKADILAVNPDVINSKKNNKNNCTFCGAAYVLRRMGYDVVANYTDGTGGLDGDTTLKEYTDAVFGKGSSKTLKTKKLDMDAIRKSDTPMKDYFQAITENNKVVMESVKEMKNGDVGMVFIENQYKGYGHCLNIQKDKGKVYMVDAQGQYTRELSEYMKTNDNPWGSSFVGNYISEINVINPDKVKLNLTAINNICHDELSHYGVPGQEWYKRQYQNEDGSLTELGRVHYGVGPARQTKSGDPGSQKTFLDTLFVDPVEKFLSNDGKEKDPEYVTKLFSDAGTILNLLNGNYPYNGETTMQTVKKDVKKSLTKMNNVIDKILDPKGTKVLMKDIRNEANKILKNRQNMTDQEFFSKVSRYNTALQIYRQNYEKKKSWLQAMTQKFADVSADKIGLKLGEGVAEFLLG